MHDFPVICPSKMQDNIFAVERLEAKKIEQGKTFYLVLVNLKFGFDSNNKGKMGWL